MNYFRQLFRRIVQPFLWLGYRWYLSKPRWYSHAGLRIRILPSVFHPGLLISTKVLLKFVLQQDLKNKRVLELGAGSGMIALASVRAGAIVTATDINPKAIASMKESSQKNGLPLTLIESDLFQNIPLQAFDFIFINPPYYPKQPNNHQEYAFFCGADFEYFRQLFSQLPSFLEEGTVVYLILNDDCAIETIRHLALEKSIAMPLLFQTKKIGEVQYIFGLEIRSQS